MMMIMMTVIFMCVPSISFAAKTVKNSCNNYIPPPVLPLIMMNERTNERMTINKIQ